MDDLQFKFYCCAKEIKISSVQYGQYKLVKLTESLLLLLRTLTISYNNKLKTAAEVDKVTFE